MKVALRRFGFDDGDPLLTWLNAAKMEFVRAAEWPWLRANDTQTLAVGDGSLAMPSDFGKIYFLWDVTREQKLTPKDPRSLYRDLLPTDTGDPEYYYLSGHNQISIWRVPDEATELQLHYLKLPSDWEDGGNTDDIPAMWHFPIVRGAAAIGLAAENEEDRSTAAFSQFQSAIGDAISYYSLDNVDEFDQVQDVEGYTGGY